MRKLVFALIALLALSSPGLAEDVGYKLESFELRTGHDLYEVCALSPNHEHHYVARAYCYGFIEGAGQFHDALVLGPDFAPFICAPDEVTLADAATVFAQYAVANPQFMKESAIDNLIRAAALKWPCKK